MEPPPTPMSSRPTRPPSSEPSALLVAAAFVPIGFAVVLAFIAPSFYAPLLDERVNVFGQRPLIPFAGALLALLLFDLAVLYGVRSSFVHGIVLALSTTAGVLLVVLAPAIAIISVTLGGVAT